MKIALIPYLGIVVTFSVNLVFSPDISLRKLRDFPSNVTLKYEDFYREDVVEWLIGRVEKRFGITCGLDTKREIESEFNNGSMFYLAANSYKSSYTFSQASSDKSEIFKGLVYQEAILLFSALPSLPQNGKNIPIDVKLNRKSLEQMEEGRNKFLSEVDILVKEGEAFWKGELQQYRGDVYSFNDNLLQGNPKISINIVSMTKRFASLLKRIKELKIDTENKNFELVITIADPENLSETMINELSRGLKSAGFSSKVVLSQRNTIAINRNLGASVSQGRFFVFLDDDVQLVGPVIARLIKALEDYPELGIVSVPSYDFRLKIHRPGSYHLKYAINEEVALTNRVSGMIMATRRDIVKVVPFVMFWPNFGEDLQFSMQVNRLGYMNAFIYPKDAYVIHEDVSERLTMNANTFTNVLIYEGLSYYLEASDTVDKLRENLTVIRLKQYGGNQGSMDSIKMFWDDFRVEVENFLNGDSESLQGLLGNIYKNEWARERFNSIKAAISYLEENKAQIIKFKNGEYERKRFTKVNPFLGPLEY